MPRRYPSLQERIAARSAVDERGCLIWTGPLHDAMGYVRISIAGRMTYAHRAIWESANGPIPSGLVVRHSCDAPSCVNLSHLALGTQRENVADMFARRRADRRGERNNSARLTASQVREIRSRYASGHSRQRLAETYQISRSQINNIVNRLHWREVS